MFDIFLCKMAGDVVFTPVNVIFLKFRPLVLTDFLTLAAPSVEMAAAGRIHRGRHITLQNDPLFLMMNIRNRNRGEKGLGVWMNGIAVQLIRLSQLHDSAKIHDCDSVADILHHAQIVGDEDIGQIALFLQFL